MNPGKILYTADEDPPILMTLSQAFQHILALFSSLVVLPTILATAIGLSSEELQYIIFVTILITAVTTFIQAYGLGPVGSGYTLFMGPASIFLACALSAAHVGGYALVITMSIVAAPIEVLFSYFLGHLRRVVTPVVGGVVIMIVSITLIPLALEFWVGRPGTPSYQQPENLFLGLITFLIILGISIFGRPSWRLFGPVIGIMVGYTTASFMGLLDLSPLQEVSFIGVPSFHWPGFYFDFSAEFFSVLAAFVMVTVVSSIETVGDVMATQRVSERDFRKVDYRRVQGALYSDALGNVLAGLAGTLPNTSFSGNISIIEITGVASRKIGMFGAMIIGVLAFFPWLSAMIVAIPEPVLGASLFIFFTMLFVTGVKIATHDGLNSRSAFILGLSFWTGFAVEFNLFFPALIPQGTEAFFTNGIAVGGMMAFILSAIFVLFPGKKERFVVNAHLEELTRLQDFINETVTGFSLTTKTRFEMQLLCEEVFVYLVDSLEEEGGKEQKIHFTIIADEEGLLVEVVDRSEVSDLDLAHLPEDLEEASKEELGRLGLALLGKIAYEVVHVRISGVNYISFRLYNKE